MDCNRKDGVHGIATIAAALRNRYHFVQGPRFIPDGHSVNTPRDRYLAIRLIHASITSRGRWHYSDNMRAASPSSGEESIRCSYAYECHDLCAFIEERGRFHGCLVAAVRLLSQVCSIEGSSRGRPAFRGPGTGRESCLGLADPLGSRLKSATRRTHGALSILTRRVIISSATEVGMCRKLFVGPLMRSET